MSDLPDPLTPADCDLRGFEWMPLFGARLFTSTFEAHASDLAFRIAIRLYWECWLQVPAASLPNDDVMLCRLAGLGRDIKTWRKLRADGVLHGFILCNDDRLYHRMLADEAVKALDCRLRSKEREQSAKEDRANATERMRQWRERKKNGSNDAPCDSHSDRHKPVTVTVTKPSPSVTVTPPVTPLGPITQYQVTSTEVKEDININPLPSNGLVGSRARDEAAPDGLKAIEDELGIEPPKRVDRTHDEENLSADPRVIALAKRTAKAMEMRIPYGQVRTAEAQADAMLAQPQVVGADEAMGMRWAPADPKHAVQQQIAAAEAGYSPEQLERARQAFLARRGAA